MSGHVRPLFFAFLGAHSAPPASRRARDGNMVAPVAQRCRPGRNAATAAAGKHAVHPHFFLGPMNTMPLRGSGLWVPDNPAGERRCKMAPVAAAGFRGRQRATWPFHSGKVSPPREKARAALLALAGGPELRYYRTESEHLRQLLRPLPLGTRRGCGEHASGFRLGSSFGLGCRRRFVTR